MLNGLLQGNNQKTSIRRVVTLVFIVLLFVLTGIIIYDMMGKLGMPYVSEVIDYMKSLSISIVAVISAGEVTKSMYNKGEKKKEGTK